MEGAEDEDEKPVSGQEMDGYLSVYKMLEECKARFPAKNLDFPLSEEISIIFCRWLVLLERGLQAGTKNPISLN